jgi:hemerythrin
MGKFFEWSEAYCVDRGPIDEEHKRLLILADDALRAVGPPLDAESLKQTVKLLFKYMDTHFENEERFMRAVHFEGVERQCELHRELARNMKGLLTSAKSLQELGDALPYIVIDWVTGHLLTEDAQIARHLEKRGHAVAPGTGAPVADVAGPGLTVPVGG